MSGSSDIRGTVIRRAVFASFLGNFIEWYDYASYSYLATVIAVIFFPQDNPRVALVQTFAVFALSFLLRPIGAVVWGAVGDRFGRRRALSVSILMMTGASFCIGCLPSYVVVGGLAPLGLLLCRMVQGFSASGEYAGAAIFIAEYAPPKRRGLFVSIVPASTAGGLLLGSLSAVFLESFLAHAQLLSWGWRLPFLLAGPLGLLARRVWLKLEDSPLYKGLTAEKTPATMPAAPIRLLWKDHRKSLVIGIGVASLNAVGFYSILTYLPTYLSSELGLDATRSLIASNISLLFYLVAIFGMGWLSDHVGRKRMLIAACLGFVLFSIPLFMLLSSGEFWKVCLAQALLCLFLTANDGTMASFLSESFPTELRYTGFAVSQNLANAIFGGTASVFCTWLIGVTGSTLSPAWYLSVVSVLSLVMILRSHERTGKSLYSV